MVKLISSDREVFGLYADTIRETNAIYQWRSPFSMTRRQVRLMFRRLKKERYRNGLKGCPITYQRGARWVEGWVWLRKYAGLSIGCQYFQRNHVNTARRWAETPVKRKKRAKR